MLVLGGIVDNTCHRTVVNMHWDVELQMSLFLQGKPHSLHLLDIQK